MNEQKIGFTHKFLNRKLTVIQQSEWSVSLEAPPGRRFRSEGDFFLRGPLTEDECHPIRTGLLKKRINEYIGDTHTLFRRRVKATVNPSPTVIIRSFPPFRDVGLVLSYQFSFNNITKVS